MASKVRKVELLCDILEAKKIKCFKGEHNLLCQYFIEVDTGAENGGKNNPRGCGRAPTMSAPAATLK